MLAELAVRRGDPDASERLAELAVLAERAGEPQRIVPVIELTAEAALTSGEPIPTDLFEELGERIRAPDGLRGRYALRLAAWAAVAGVEIELPQPVPGPYAAMLARDWSGAAAAFGELDWVYDSALMLSLLDDEAALVDAMEIARRLGAEPLTRRLTVRMRELGMRVPKGPRRTTRANAAGLTARQLEVVELIVEGLTNAEIAERLVVSQRTAEHHVAAVLTKLGATTRREAARRASELPARWASRTANILRRRPIAVTVGMAAPPRTCTAGAGPPGDAQGSEHDALDPLPQPDSHATPASRRRAAHMSRVQRGLRISGEVDRVRP